MQSKKLSGGLKAALLPIFTTIVFVTSTYAAEKMLHIFMNKDGQYPDSSLIFDAAGNLYGTTIRGGTGSCTDYNGSVIGCGTVFALTPAAGGGWKEKVLHMFNHNGKDGYFPNAGLIFDAAGNLYGTTYGGGTYGYGTVYEFSHTAGGDWTEKVLHNFHYNGKGGWDPNASLIFDAAGNLYGTTIYGGAYNNGTVFELSPTADGGWTEKVLHSFGNGKDGTRPLASLVLDTSGNLYGTTGGGGAHWSGTVFELTAGGAWTERVLHSFGFLNGTDGVGPDCSLILDAAGNLYGTTTNGGTYAGGTVFKLSPTADGGWTERVLHNFNYNGKGGYRLAKGLILDSAGNLYGTTTQGGAYGYGTVFELSPIAGGGWTEKVLHSFNNNGKDGLYPVAGLVFDAAGNLYGTTDQGGTYGYGTVFEITP